jgi:hypothetical protein
MMMMAMLMLHDDTIMVNVNLNIISLLNNSLMSIMKRLSYDDLMVMIMGFMMLIIIRLLDYLIILW